MVIYRIEAKEEEEEEEEEDKIKLYNIAQIAHRSISSTAAI